MEIWCFPPLEKGEAIVAQAGFESPNEPDYKDSLQEKNENAMLNHLHYLESLGLKMQGLLDEIDEHFITNILLLIRKTVKKIILKELTVDDQLFREMVLQVVDKIKPLPDSCVVNVSQDDLALFQQNPLSFLTVEVNPRLEKGDFLIKTPFTEVEALLEKRINLLLGLNS